MFKHSIRSMSSGLVTLTTLSLLLVGSVHAKPIKEIEPLTPPEPGRATCSVDDVQITEIKRQDGSPALALPNAANPIDATGCLGAYSGNDSGKGIDSVGDNRGFLNDGLLNNTDIFPEFGAFLTAEDLLDLQGTGTAQDPGWVFVGKTDFNKNGSGSNTNGTITNGDDSYTFSIGDILMLHFTNPKLTTGTFTYKPPQTNPQALLDVLGANKFFDQAAVILKASDQWAIYNFKISDLGLPPVIGTVETNFMFSGTFDLSGTFLNNGGNTPGLSHVSLWLRDPFGTTSTIPTPGTLMSLLLGLGLLLAGRRKFLAKQ